MLSINSNINASMATYAMRQANAGEVRAGERLSSGSRVNSAADDAAGLSVGTRMQSQFLGIQRSVQNATDWVSLFQTAEGGLNEINNMLKRMRELTVQADNATLNNNDRNSLNLELK